VVESVVGPRRGTRDGYDDGSGDGVAG
jgi:hypothetical protein